MRALWSTPVEGSEFVRRFWLAAQEEYHTTVCSKASSVSMRVVGRALELMGIAAARDFLAHYATTIGRTIYVPFVPGTPAERWGLWDQILVCVHEHQHVVQLERDGRVRFSAKYLLSSARRAQYECEALRTTQELDHWYGAPARSPELLAHELLAYGCSDADVAVAKQYLELSARPVAAGGVVSATTKWAISWLEGVSHPVSLVPPV